MFVPGASDPAATDDAETRKTPERSVVAAGEASVFGLSWI